MSAQLVASLTTLAPGQAVAATVRDHTGADVALAIVRTEDGTVHAVSEYCTHGQVSLVEGDIEDCTIECWAHGARFNLVTGQGSLPAPSPITVYSVILDGDDVLVDVDA
ncbi:Rieske (2Fe-2S) protein [Buchananella hordeovulneris]|uniref:(2Fe-2S)-binding protein n=1 Tax=Buchananella hordeovulneris TaxID=52770 RepID=A0A1Q5PXK7_9ACTO|nr:Rieske 2Fe-2S domain-containing protein [Buchananella hordeovulneris]MDO5081293.1 Rieske 2Fe-2S domain-containing protein [Buchananella hordeovulneris]OKL52267.1 (2Fe-2S)-binding protein [Buchananella hordeovulneris]RRD45542.1 non-heme iron oxygenase ferredoxin subunit [Buchananella hordeovulneris]RRD52328.1 non-heme iron oxygenase ferredoxin subunit [Buchananella hordeovulneris]